MELAILSSGTALILFSLWAIARHDLLRMTRKSVKVKARVVGHRSTWDDGQKYYSARFAFCVDGHWAEVVDQKLNGSPCPPVDHDVWLHYPQGRPDLARIARTGTWAIVYVALGAMLVMSLVEIGRLLR